ncbi:MAG TPA: hypothetical protein VM142_02150 [Acidimicrobiales bacterium]|nr:hypothetical protein [Acidimicrobiales bacterium]
MTATPRLLHEVIKIPTEVHKDELVYQLHDDPAKTLKQYVVTPQLGTAFLKAVKLVRSAMVSESSKAAFLHGSFGSGKSNFMGVLQLLLDGNRSARAVPELALVVTELDKGTGKVLTVPFHLIGAKDLESAVFGQYVDHVHKRHPDAPPPAVYADEPILVNADGLRATMGDNAFFTALSAGSDDAGWGDLGAAWDASSYDAARTKAQGNAGRVRLVQALVTTLLSAYSDVSRANRSGYVGFDDGLSAISWHAKNLGYDAVVLFLDELILWFLSRLGDTTWVSDEASKLSKLVEPGSARRPIPIVSIIARQRDLRELVGDSVPGAEKLSFADQLDYQHFRFTEIKLDDSNLPMVANRRLLQPKDGDAASTLAAAFASLSLPPKTRDALLAETGDDESFRLTYPFSPAFMTVLVDVAGALQRTRTGLRVLLELLVARRDVLEIGQLVPVGDLYDVIDSGDDPFSDAMRAAFDQARKIYKERLRPAMLSEHHLGPHDEPTQAFANEDRLIKTLLLAALVPQSVPFKDLTVERLVALNHGSISSPVPGQETGIAVAKLKRLAAQAGELRLGSDPNNPTVAVVLSDVDAGAILATADNADNASNRRTLVRELVLDALGLPRDQLQTTYSFLWRGLRRDVTLTFGNLRDTEGLPDAAFANDGPGWKLLVDFPFDDPGHSLREDLERIDRFRQNGSSWLTLGWLPSFFTYSTLDTLGRLVRLNHVLANDDRFAEATATLSPVARASAKPQLQAMQTAARNQLDHALLMAYGVVSADQKVVDTSHTLADHFPSLRAGLTLLPPVATSLRDALDRVLDQALRHTYPGAPELESEVKLGDVRRIAELCANAVVEPDGRLMVNDTGDRRLLTRIANPLQLGLQSEQAFKLQSAAERWDNTFTRASNRVKAEGTTPTVGVLRQAINTPDATGLSTALENLIILVWAQATNHSFRQHGGRVAGAVDRLDDDWEVVAQPLPTQAQWVAALERLGHVFGIEPPTKHLSGFAVERAGIALRAAVTADAAAVRGLVERLEQRGGDLGIAEPDNDRLRTARGTDMLLADLNEAADDLSRVVTLAGAAMVPSALALGRSIKSAGDISARLDAAQWPILTSAFGRADGATLRSELATALAADELVTALGPVLDSVQSRAVTLLAGSGAPTSTPAPPAAPGSRQYTATGLADAKARLAELETKVADGAVADGSIAVTINWVEANPGGSG